MSYHWHDDEFGWCYCDEAGWVVDPADPDVGRFEEVAYHEGGDDDYIAALIREEES